MPPAGQQPVDHWDALFAAVTTTLRDAATRPRAPNGPAEWPSRETTILECVRQLELLHDALRAERGLVDRSARRVVALLEPPAAGPCASAPAQSARPPPALSSAQSSSCTSTR